MTNEWSVMCLAPTYAARHTSTPKTTHQPRIERFIVAVLWCDIRLCEIDQWELSLQAPRQPPRMTFAHSSFATRVAFRWRSVLWCHVRSKDAQLLLWNLLKLRGAVLRKHCLFSWSQNSMHFTDPRDSVSCLHKLPPLASALSRWYQSTSYLSLWIQFKRPSRSSKWLLQTCTTKPYIHFSSFPCDITRMSHPSYV